MARRYRDEHGRFISETEAITRAERALERAANWVEEAGRARSAKAAARAEGYALRADAQFEHYQRQLRPTVQRVVLSVPAEDVPDVEPAARVQVPDDDDFADEYLEDEEVVEDVWEIELAVDYEP